VIGRGEEIEDDIAGRIRASESVGEWGGNGIASRLYEESLNDALY
jgi:hypothetical protein